MKQKIKDETEKCYLEWGKDGHLTCSHNHTIGALCLANKCDYCNELECVCYAPLSSENTPEPTAFRLSNLLEE